MSIHRRLILTALTISAALAQGNGIISGVVRDAETGAPLAGVRVSVQGSSQKSASTTTDSQGRYRLGDIPPGQVGLSAGAHPETAYHAGQRTVTLAAGQELHSIDIPMRGVGRVSGRIADDEGKPVTRVEVAVVRGEYSMGALRYRAEYGTLSDQEGNYGGPSGLLVYSLLGVSSEDQVSSGLTTSLDELAALAVDFHGTGRAVPAGIPLEAGRGHLLVAHRERPTMAAPTDAPVDPKQRKTVLASSWYPGSGSLEGAIPLTLGAGENREQVNFRLDRVPAYCIQGTAPATGPEKRALGIVLSDRRLPGGPGSFHLMMRAPDGAPGHDSRIRICNVPPGDYLLSSFVQVQGAGLPVAYSTATVTIKDDDIRDLALATQPRMAVAGEVVWDNASPDPPVAASLTIRLRPLAREPFKDESAGAKVAVPGRFALENLLADEYALDFAGVPAGAYVKEATYGGASVLHTPLPAGSANLRITLARDGGRVVARVADADGNPVSGAVAVVSLASVTSEAAFADSMITGRTDASGAWTSGLLAPGKYSVTATLAQVDRSPECIGRLYHARGKAEEAEIGAGATVSVNVAAIQ